MGGQVRASGHPGTGHTVSDFATFLPAPAALVEFECADAASPVASAAGAVSLLFFLLRLMWLLLVVVVVFHLLHLWPLQYS
jgi:hypothetical protein